MDDLRIPAMALRFNHRREARELDSSSVEIVKVAMYE
jgi:hypothetical protein